MDPTTSGFSFDDLLSADDPNSLYGGVGANSANQEKRTTLQDQMKLAQQVRGGMPQAKGTFIPGKGGGVYVGASGLQNAADMAQYVMGYKQAKDALDKQGQLDTNDQQTRQKMIANIIRQNVNTDQSQNPDIQALGGQVPSMGGNTAPSSMGPPGGAPPPPQPPPQQPPQNTAQMPGGNGPLDPTNPQTAAQMFQMLNGGANPSPIPGQPQQMGADAGSYIDPQTGQPRQWF
jgi:hypothetical protein